MTTATVRKLSPILNVALISRRGTGKVRKVTDIRVFMADILVASATFAGDCSREWAEREFKKPGHPGFQVNREGYDMARSFGLI